MAGNSTNGDLSSNVTDNRMNYSATSGETGDSECGLLYISGIASNETVRGLYEFSDRYSRVHGYIAVAVCLFGVLSNSANIIVLTRKNMISSTNIILLWLAVADLLTMLDYLPFAIHFYITKPVNVKRHAFSTPEFSWICFLLFHASFSIVCHTVAIWLTIALAIFRYIYIRKPTRGSYYCSQKRACLVVVVVIILTILICIPNYAVNTYDFHQGLSTVASVNNGTMNDSVLAQKNKDNGSYFYPQLKQETDVDEITNLVNGWVQAILIKLIPCFMLTTLTLLLLHAMHKAYRRRLKLKSQGRRAESDKHGEHNRTTGMLLAVVVLFTLTELPQGILTLMNIFIKCFTEVVYNKLGDLLDIMALINNSVNFVLYCTMSKQFRTTFAAVFCPVKPSRPRWLKLRIKSRQGNNTLETMENAACNDHVKNNCGVANNSRAHIVSDKLFDNDKNSKEMCLNNFKDGIEDSYIKNKLSPAMDINHGLSTHTHGYSPDCHHV